MTRPSPSKLRPLWLAAGFLLTGLGFLGLVLPGFPGTVWLVLAAAAFAKGDPRWEAWLLSRPVVGELIRDYHQGRGMPLKAKWLASFFIILAVSLSYPRIPVQVGQISAVILAVIGVLYVTLRVPTKRDA